jgi:hypothetical protein
MDGCFRQPFPVTVFCVTTCYAEKHGVEDIIIACPCQGGEWNNFLSWILWLYPIRSAEIMPTPGSSGQRSLNMDNMTFGLTLLVVGMGGTLVALATLALLMELLKKIFPHHNSDAK